jgi:hypothetical protein
VAEQVMAEFVRTGVALQGFGVTGVQADPESIVLAQIEAE